MSNDNLMIKQIGIQQQMQDSDGDGKLDGGKNDPIDNRTSKSWGKINPERPKNQRDSDGDGELDGGKNDPIDNRTSKSWGKINPERPKNQRDSDGDGELDGGKNDPIDNRTSKSWGKINPERPKNQRDSDGDGEIDGGKNDPIDDITGKTWNNKLEKIGAVLDNANIKMSHNTGKAVISDNYGWKIPGINIGKKYTVSPDK